MSAPSSHEPTTATHHHPPIAEYITVFKWLTGLTIFELILAVSTHTQMLPLPEAALAVILIVAGLIKAVLVVAYYMHLKYDSRWYTVVLLAGVFFAVLLGAMLPFVLK